MLGADAAPAWEPSVVDQFTRNGALWGVPQLTDAGIAVYFNADLLDAAGVDLAELVVAALVPRTATTRCGPCWPGSPSTPTDNRGDTPGFDAGRIRQWGYNAANDLQGIYLNYIGSAGGVFSATATGSRSTTRGRSTAFDYLVRPDQHRPRRAARRRTPTTTATSPATSSCRAGWRCSSPAPTTWPRSPTRRRFRWGVAMLPDRPDGPRQRHQRHCRGGQFGDQASRRGAPGAGLDGQHAGQRVPRRRRRGHPRRARGPAGLLRLLGRQGRRRQPVLRRARTARASRRPAAPGSPPASRRSSRTSTRCSWAAAMSRRRCGGPRRPPTPPRRAAEASHRASPDDRSTVSSLSALWWRPQTK